jgi:hypothetical protein
MALPAGRFLFLAGVLVMAPAPILSRTAHAEVRVEGRIDSIRLEAQDASVREAFEALSAEFGLLVQDSAGLDRRISGTYQGSLRQVVSTLLAGRNYVAIHSGGRMEIRDFGAINGTDAPSAAAPAAAFVVSIIKAGALAPVSPPTSADRSAVSVPNLKTGVTPYLTTRSPIPGEPSYVAGNAKASAPTSKPAVAAPSAR